MPQETSLKSENEARFDAPDEAAILQAFCRTRLTALPPGSRGLRAATEVLGALPAACNLGWPDMTVSAPQLFRMFRHAGLVSDEPTACDMPAALRLVASVCELVVQRSPRRWTVWFSRACDPEDALFISIRKAVTSAMLRRSAQSAPPESRPRPTSVRAERKRLATEFDRVRAELASLSERYVTAQAGIESAQADAKAARVETERANEDANATRAKMRSAMADGKAARAQMENAMAEARTARAQTASAKTEMKTARAETARAQADAKAARAETARAKAEVKVFCHDLSKLHGVQDRLHEVSFLGERKQKELQRKLEQSRGETDKLRLAKQAIEDKRVALQTELADLRVASELSEKQLKGSRDEWQRYANDYTSRFETALHKIQAILAIEFFDPNEVETFVGTVERKIFDERARSEHVATVCANALDENITRFIVSYERIAQSIKRVPEANLDQAVHEQREKLRTQIMALANQVRKKLEQQGVRLPPAQPHL